MSRVESAERRLGQVRIAHLEAMAQAAKPGYCLSEWMNVAMGPYGDGRAYVAVPADDLLILLGELLAAPGAPEASRDT